MITAITQKTIDHFFLVMVIPTISCALMTTFVGLALKDKTEISPLRVWIIYQFVYHYYCKFSLTLNCTIKVNKKG